MQGNVSFHTFLWCFRFLKDVLSYNRDKAESSFLKGVWVQCCWLQCFLVGAFLALLTTPNEPTNNQASMAPSPFWKGVPVTICH